MSESEPIEPALPEPKPGSPHDLIRLGITLAAIAVALATFERNTRPSDIQIERGFLFLGAVAAIGTGYAMAQLWLDSNMRSPRHLLLLDRPEGMDLRFEAVVLLTLAMIGFIGIYLVMLIKTTM